MIKNGTIYIRNQGVITQDVYGFRDLPNRIPNNLETSFPTASAGKVFVAVGILHLIERGKLSLQTTLREMLPMDLGKIDKDVTVYQLLTHTSGVPDYCDEDRYPNYAMLWKDYPNYKIRSSKDLLPLFIHLDMQYKKGTKFKYNDSGFVLLGLIIEAITLKPFDIFLNELIFKPLGMNRTGYYELDRLPKNCASGYIYDQEKDEYYSHIYSIDVKGTGAGGCFTNPHDISLFWDALLSYKLLTEETTALMLKKHQVLENCGYGLGIWLDESDHPEFVGVDPGATFISNYHLEKHRLITIISNMEEDVFKELQKLKAKE